MIDNKYIAQTALGFLGGKPKVNEYWDDNRSSKIDVFIGVDRPYEGVISYSTIGLSNYSIGVNLMSNKELRVEFLGACGNKADKFANIVSTCAFNIINSKYSCKPGSVYPNVVHEYYPNSDMKHILFTTPFLWDNIHNLEFDNITVTWLMCVPISDNEFEFLKTNGSDLLEDLFEKNSIDVFDINRKSVV